jgi:hypothetical protein
MLGVGAIFMGGVVPAISHSMVTLSLGALGSSFIGFVIWRLSWRTE